VWAEPLFGEAKVWHGFRQNHLRKQFADIARVRRGVFEQAGAFSEVRNGWRA
jgi:hypothetical protein